MTKPWMDEDNDPPEFHVGSAPLVRVCCGANQTVEVDKLYGPLAAVGVRVRLEYSDDVADWVVEREIIGSGERLSTWVEVARFDCQQDWPEEPTP